MSTSFVFGMTELNADTFVAVTHPDGAYNGHFDAVMSNASAFYISGDEAGTVVRPVPTTGFESDWKADGAPSPTMFYAKATASNAGSLIVTSLRR
jgi:hypothetical protein